MTRRAYLALLFAVAFTCTATMKLTDGEIDLTGGIAGELATALGMTFFPMVVAALPMWRRPTSRTPYVVSAVLLVAVLYFMWLGNQPY